VPETVKERHTECVVCVRMRNLATCGALRPSNLGGLAGRGKPSTWLVALGLTFSFPLPFPDKDAAMAKKSAIWTLLSDIPSKLDFTRVIEGGCKNPIDRLYRPGLARFGPIALLPQRPPPPAFGASCIIVGDENKEKALSSRQGKAGLRGLLTRPVQTPVPDQIEGYCR